MDDTVPPASGLLARLLDPSKKLDYLWLAVFAALPMALAAWLGVFRTTGGFVGYGATHNWTSLVLVLPAAVFGFRMIMRRIAAVSSVELPKTVPPIVTLIPSDDGRRKAYQALREALLSPNNLLAALLIAGVAQMADMAKITRVYLSPVTEMCAESATQAGSECAKEVEGNRLEIRSGDSILTIQKDWGSAYLRAEPRPAKGVNVVFTLVAYAVQFSVIFVGVLFIVLVCRHNLHFLSRIYQRRWVEPGDEHAYVQIDIDDRENCFGFRRANNAFNVQVMALGIAAVFMLATRFEHVGRGSGLFPEVGQALMVATWFAGLLIISLPILLKLLPRLPDGLARLLGLPAPEDDEATDSLVGYLREYLPEEVWDVDDTTPAAEIDAVAARFAENAFWPTGNNRAWQLYFVSFWAILFALVPNPVVFFDQPPAWYWWLALIAVEGALAWLITWAMFVVLRGMLSWVDPRLAGPADGAASGRAAQRRRKIPFGLFISYRRSDSAAYTGRLYDSLARHVDKDKVFMDLDDISGGADFVDAIERAIASSKAMIVVIGPDWLTSSHGNGSPRIQDPTDFVHQEIALGLSHGLQILPVLVGRATMPGEAQLPEALKPLARRNARELSDSRWLHDVGLLIADLDAGMR